MTELNTTQELMEHPSEHLVQNLAAQVEGVLWRFDRLRQSNSEIEVIAKGSKVRLEGNVRTDSLRAIAGHLAARVDGVSDVENALVSDTRIESDLSLAIALDDATAAYTDKVRIKSLQGVVSLGGALAREAMADADTAVARAGELAEAIPGVSQVVNGIRSIEGTDEDAFAAPDEVIEEEVTKVEMAKAMGTLIPDDRKDKIRAMIKARVASRGDGAS